MKSYLKLLLLIVLCTGVMTSCKKAVPKQAKHIPKTASFVTTINSKSLQNKILLNQVTLENILKYASGNDTTVNKGKQEWEELKNSGIDLDDNFYISIVQKDASMLNRKGTMVYSALATLNDEKKLQAYIKKKHPAAEIKKEKNYTYTKVEDVMIAWAEDLAIAMNYSANVEMEFDSTTGAYNLKRPANMQVDMIKEMDSYFTLKEDASIAAIPEFRDLMADKADASMWVNSSTSLEAVPLPKMKELFGSSYTAARLNFEDGKIAIDSKSFYSKELRDILKKYSGASANLDMVEKYPSKDINGFFVFTINPEFVNAIVKQLELGGMVDAWLTKSMGTNYSLQDLLKSVKGDFAMIVSDTKFAPGKADSKIPAPSNPQFQMLANIAVGDKTQMFRLMDKMAEKGLMVKTANGFALSPEMKQKGISAVVTDKNILVSMNENLLNQYQSGNNKADIDKTALSQFKDKQGAAYINIAGLLNGINISEDSTNGKIVSKAKETFKDFRGSIEKFDGKTIEGHYYLTFKNEKENSLTSILNFLETASKNIDKKRVPAINPDSIPVSKR